MKRIIHFFVCFFCAVFAFQANAQVTTSSIVGRVYADSELAAGANVTAVHTPSGTEYFTVSDAKGNYHFPAVRVGGPYTLTATYVGFKDAVQSNIYIGLAQSAVVDLKAQTDAQQTSEVVVVSTRLRDDKKNGTSTTIGAQQIQTLPTLSRGLNDFLRTTPQASVNGSGGISIAGMNNRYNAIFIDGAVNNDVFGLASSGTNGGQSNISPISIDAIEQFNVSIAPYDVTLGGFAGAGINAVTRSGTNNFEGSLYSFFRNQALVGSRRLANGTNSSVSDFASQIHGFRLGGAIVKNKLFFFVNAEIERAKTPRNFDLSTYAGTSKAAQLEALRTKLIEYGYDPGDYQNADNSTKSEKIIAKLDWNISRMHKLSLRHSYTRGVDVFSSASNANTINFSNTARTFPSVTHSSALELNSTFNSKFSNKLIVGYTNVNDDRNPTGNPFPFVIINDGAGRINFGSEAFSSANQLKQQILTLTNNFNIYIKNHKITLGTHNEYGDFYNLFIRQNYGQYRYANLNNFLNNGPISIYERSYSIVDKVVGDGSIAAAQFRTLQVGAYAQDDVTFGKLNIQAGVRVDVPFLLDKPQNHAQTDVVLATIANTYDIQGAQGGVAPEKQLMISPRIGFNYDVFGNKKTIVRGGAGLFTSRIPFVWPGGMYTNNGIILGTLNTTPNASVTFRPDINDQYTQSSFGGSDKTPTGELNLFSKNFKYPQVARGSFAIDQKLPADFKFTVEGIYTKTLNNIVYQNINLKIPTATLNGAGNRAYYTGNILNTTRDRITTDYSDIYLASNTDKGYSYNLTGQLSKSGVINEDVEYDFMAAYTYGRSTSVFDGTSSQNSSQWRNRPVSGLRNDINLEQTSDFDLGHRFVVSSNIGFRLNKALKTSVALFYNGQSGTPYSLVYGQNNLNGASLTGENNSNANLFYIPKDRSDIALETFTTGGVTRTADQQWNELDAFIKANPELDANRGKISERNALRLPFTHVIDLRLIQDITFVRYEKEHTIQLTLDIFNLTNLLNPSWGQTYFTENNVYEVAQFRSVASDVPTFRVNSTPEPALISDFTSRWRMQFGLRYSFR
jgi:hypothetical protein